jgi:hypothetical protein
VYCSCDGHASFSNYYTEFNGNEVKESEIGLIALTPPTPRRGEGRDEGGLQKKQKGG